MKIKTLLLTLILMFSSVGSVNAFWNNGWNNSWNNWNPYDVWDPRYWMEEMEDMFDDDWWNNNYSNYGGYGRPYYGNQMIYTNPNLTKGNHEETSEQILPKHNPYMPYGMPYQPYIW